ncbi:FAD dependent oxidoreductase-domain-containing protein [Stachybotrys elegans]|uniref:Glycerol-3-phosphate dehydrogenase n=1 Tax=Stachybotrys elegans TaxID=80388 RepID=A0A8K0SVE7_9HYPO|nr:FAD dependent oxidoreductase-domain-containing protein [Stachybotrys elegans]
MASSRFSTLRRPLVAATAAAVTATLGGAVVYRSFSSKSHIVDEPLAPVKRDASGRIVPPSFPAVKSRAEHLADLRRHGAANKGSQDEYDLLIIGGGATGTGIALDAATRGLKVALVERDDFAAGTSSKSTKLVHGGVRYLEKAVMNLDYPQLELVMEALHERKTFLTIAPHLSNSVPILLPIQRWWEAPYFWAGTKAYDFLAGSQGLESSYYMPKSKALASFPLLRRSNLVGALVYYDGQHNDARMNFSLALTAALYGATVVNHVEVTGLEKDANGRICGAKVRDTLASLNNDSAGATEFTVRAKGVINATGPFADAVERMDDASRPPIVAPASGVHVMLPGNICPNRMGLLDASSDGRVIFVLPWQGYTVAGTTDTACDIEQHPVARKEEVKFVLKEVNKLLTPEATLTEADVLSTWSGIRPLVKDPKAKNTESLVRSHLVTVSPSGLLTCAGGKWTTYRQMAEDAVDEAVKTFKLTPRAMTQPDISGTELPGFITNGTCRTRNVPLVGAHGFSTRLPAELMELHKIDADIADHLAHSYGDRSWTVLANESPSATTRLLPSFPFIEAEVRHAARQEAACTAADLISRRTRLSFLDVDSALMALPRVIDVMGEELGWSEKRKAHEWTETVQFFKSMGLDEEKLSLTRAEVEKKGAALATPKRTLTAGSSKGLEGTKNNIELQA